MGCAWSLRTSCGLGEKVLLGDVIFVKVMNPFKSAPGVTQGGGSGASTSNVLALFSFYLYCLFSATFPRILFLMCNNFRYSMTCLILMFQVLRRLLL